MERLLEIRLIVCGIKVYEPYEGNLFTLKQCEVDCSGAHLSNCVQFDYSVTVKADPSVSGQEYVNRVLEREVGLFQQSLSLLLMRPSHLITYEAKLDGVGVKYKPFPQHAPLGLYSLASMWRRLPDPLGYSVSVRGSNGWNLLEYMISNYRQRPVIVSRRLALPLCWFTKGSNEFRISDRLVAFWISFNALYANPQIHNERDSIENYIKNMDSVMAQRYANDNKGLLEILSQFSIEPRRRKGKQKIAQDLAVLLRVSPQDYIALVRTTALTIYGIRNNLFHGVYDPDSENDQKHISTAEHLLSPLVRELIAKEMLGKSPPIMKLVSEEILNG